MQTAEKPIRFDDFLANAEAIFERMERERTGVLVERAGVVYSLKPKPRRKPRKSGKFTLDDPFFRLAGIASTEGPTDVAANKHKYLADAYADNHEA